MKISPMLNTGLSIQNSLLTKSSNPITSKISFRSLEDDSFEKENKLPENTHMKVVKSFLSGSEYKGKMADCDFQMSSKGKKAEGNFDGDIFKFEKKQFGRTIYSMKGEVNDHAFELKFNNNIAAYTSSVKGKIGKKKIDLVTYDYNNQKTIKGTYGKKEVCLTIDVDEDKKTVEGTIGENEISLVQGNSDINGNCKTKSDLLPVIIYYTESLKYKAPPVPDDITHPTIDDIAW